MSVAAMKTGLHSNAAALSTTTAVTPNPPPPSKQPITLSSAETLVETLSRQEAEAIFKEYMRPFRRIFKAYVKSQVPSTGMTFESMVATHKEMGAATYLRCLRDHGLLIYKERRVDKERYPVKIGYVHVSVAMAIFRHVNRINHRNLNFIEFLTCIYGIANEVVTKSLQQGMSNVVANTSDAIYAMVTRAHHAVREEGWG